MEPISCIQCDKCFIAAAVRTGVQFLENIECFVIKSADCYVHLQRKAQAKRRAKIKQDKELYQAYLGKDKKRKATRRAASKLQMSAHQLEKHRVKERLHLRKYHEKKKLETLQSTQTENGQQSTSTPYRTSQSLGKAVKRAQVSLPSSPRKK